MYRVSASKYDNARYIYRGICTLQGLSIRFSETLIYVFSSQSLLFTCLIYDRLAGSAGQCFTLKARSMSM